MSADKNPSPESPDPFAQLSEGEVRILPPDYALKKIIGEDVSIQQIFSPENIAKAQAVIDSHKANFIEWVGKDIGMLEEYYAAIKANPANSEDDIRKLARTAFVIKSQAGTFGFSLATDLAKSLDDFCNAHLQLKAEHLVVIRKHIDALVLIFDKNITGDGGPIGKELSESLYRLIDKFKNK